MKTKAEYMKEGFDLEYYIDATVGDENCINVSNNDAYPGVDFLINNKGWDVKNSWNTENGGNKKLRESRGIDIWFRNNKDGSYNWHMFPYKSKLLSEEGFRSFRNQEHLPKTPLELCF